MNPTAARGSCRSGLISGLCETVEQRGREIALGKGRDDHDDCLAGIFLAGATLIAAVSAAPEEMPTGTPSRRATRRAVSKASSFVTVHDFIVNGRIEDFRRKARADALDLVGAGIARRRGPGCRPARPQ